MKNTYWIAGVLAIGLGTGIAGMAVANQGGPERPSFETLDTDADGKLTQAELDAHKAARFAKSDTNGDGMLSAEEMMNSAKANEGKRMQRRATKMIERMDADKDGMISAAEMQAMPRGKDMFKRMDANSDGAITAEEFAAGKGGYGRHHGKGQGMDGQSGGRSGQKCQNDA